MHNIRDFHEGHSTVGERHGMCESALILLNTKAAQTQNSPQKAHSDCCLRNHTAVHLHWAVHTSFPRIFVK
jgi:hypothetical protein